MTTPSAPTQANITRDNHLSLAQEAGILKVSSGEVFQHDRSRTLIDLFKDQVARTPGNIAVVFGDRRISYRELDEITDILAIKLVSLGVKAGTYVGVMVDRSEYMVIYPLAIMKAGGAYMPLDFSMPSDRLAFMVKDAGVDIILSEGGRVAEGLPGFQGAVLRCEDIPAIIGGSSINEGLPCRPTPFDVFVLLYTSGSTGVPKGCMLEHRNIVNFCRWYIKDFEVVAADRSVAYANFAFDAHMIDIYPMLITGASVYIIPSDMRLDLLRMNKYMEDNGLTIAFMTTQIGRQFAEDIQNHSLRLLSLGGERLVATKKPDFKFYNVYGPTECTLFSTFYEIRTDYDSLEIGHSLANVQNYIMDKDLNLLPLGEIGELVIGGEGVGRGYLGREELTKEKFVEWRGERLYRSGDLARYNEAGEIEYIGRMDNQVKLRGLRIELGEIETKMASYDGISGAIVDVKELGGVQHLCAYYIKKKEIDIEGLKAFLRTSLTEFMIPEAFVEMEQFPLTNNGKVNRKMLPAPQFFHAEAIAPETDTEIKLFGIVAELLQYKDFGVTTDLFHLGLTSILAIKLSIIIEKRLGISLQSKQILKLKTIRLLAEHAAGNEPALTTGIEHEKRDVYPLTETQMGVFYDWERQRESKQYNLAFSLKFPCGMDVAKLKSALIAVVDAHTYLKAIIAIDGDKVVQKRRDLQPIEVLVRKTPQKDFPEVCSAFVRPFDLYNGNLYRFEIHQTEISTYLLLDIHHIIFDGTSLSILLADLQDAVSGRALSMERFTGFEKALEEQAMLQSARFVQMESYFDKLIGGRTMFAFPNSAEARDDNKSKEYSMVVPVGAIAGFCRTNGITESNFFLSVLCQVLARYSRDNEVGLATISSGRSDSRLQNTFGMFVKTLPVFAQIKTEPIIDFVKSIQEQFFATLENEDFPFTKMVEKHGIVPQISYAYQGGLDFTVKAEGQAVELKTLPLDSSILPVVVQIEPQAEGYRILVEYDRAKYSHLDISRFVSAYSAAIRFMSESPTRLTTEISLITEEQKHAVLQLSAGPVLEFARSDTFIDIFRRQAARFPDKKAVVDEFSSLTYSELDTRSDRLAERLVVLGVQPNTIVSIMLSRCKEFMVSVIAIMKAGGAYLPLDCEYPNDRLAYMLENSESKLLITERGIFEAKKKEGEFKAEKLLFINEFNFNTGAPVPSLGNPKPGDLAYMIYTSGSTGKPKGVMIRHNSLVGCLAWYTKTVSLDDKDILCCHPSFSFDASVLDLFSSLSVGATLHIVPTGMRQDIITFSKYIVREQMTGGVFSTQFGMELLNQFDLPLRFAMLGGEKLVTLRKQKTLIINGYGPTEFTVASHYHPVNQDLSLHNIPIGRPVPNSWSYVMDANMQLLPAGMAGELCLSGIQIAKGYWRRDDLTAEKFRSNPHQTTEENSRLYCTGDLVRWNDEGELLYLGRIDNQVKLRGFRIELGEIESVLCKFEGVASAVVDVKEYGGAQHLCAYYIKKAEIDIEALREFLQASLAEYMIPEAFVEMPQLPLTSNGKVNRKLLPVPKFCDSESTPPETATEIKLFAVLADLLKTKDFGVTTDLFQLGLTSILAIRFSILIEKNLGISLQSKQILKLKTIRLLAEFADGNLQPSMPGSVQEMRDTYPLTEAQMGLYYDWERQRESKQYNLAFNLKFPASIDAEKLKRALISVVDAHTYLKTIIAIEGDKVVQKRRDQMPTAVLVRNTQQKEFASVCSAFVRPFDLFKENLYRFEIHQTENATHLLVDMHHIIFDGTSLSILLENLQDALAGRAISVERFTGFDKALAEQATLQSPRYSQMEQYFDKLIGGRTLFAFPASADAKGDDTAMDYSLIVPVGEIAGVCRKNGITESNFFLSALCQVLARYSRENEVGLTTISSGRADSRLQNTFGMFVKTLPVIAQIKTQPIIDFVKSIQEQFFATMENEDFPFTQMVEKHGIAPQISYAYQGGFDFSLTADGQSVEVETLALDTSILPLVVQIEPRNEGYRIYVEYDRTKYSRLDISRFVSGYAAAVRFMSESPTKLTSEISLISDEQKQSILQLSTGPVLEFDRNHTFIDLFRRQAARFPDKKAVVDEFSSLTYSELDLRSELLAQRLVTLGVQPNTIVSVMLSRSKEFMVSVIAILKAGGAYLPLDCEYPNDRLAYMLENSESKLLITERGIFEAKQKEGEFTAENLLLINEFNFNTAAPVTRLDSPEFGDLAYMIYTSGSTGKPKGVMIRHNSLVACLAWYTEAVSIDDKDSICCHPSFSFDASVLDLFSSLSAGATLHIVPTWMRQDMSGFSKYIVSAGITGGVFSTQFGMELLNQFELPLRFALLGGEKLVSIRKQKTLIINGYGPTEFTVASHYHPVNQELEVNNIPIGRPVPNSCSYVMDSNMQLLPVGMAGELCLSGIQIAKGYWRRDDLTAEKFRANPHQTTEENSRLYCTGDLVRWNEEGELLYLGRIDNQVKLRGFRIELGEIESALCKYEGVSSAVVDVKEYGGAQHLCGYYTKTSGIDIEALRSFLQTTLAEYMIPDAFIEMQQLPLTSNGKVNRKLLPVPQFSDSEATPPETPTEIKLFDILAALLKNRNFGVTTDLFQLGLTSILAIRFSILIEKNLGISLQSKQILKLKTIRLLAEFADSNKQAVIPGIVLEKQEVYPLTETQMGLYFDWERQRDSLQYNLAFALKFPRIIDAEKLKYALISVVEAHTYLKTIFAIEGDKVVQKRRDQQAIEVPVRNTQQTAFAAVCSAFVRPFDLFNGNLYRFEIHQTENSTYLLVDIHHVIFDGTSMSILLENLQDALAGRALSMECFTGFDKAMAEQATLQSPRYAEMEAYFDKLIGGRTLFTFPASVDKKDDDTSKDCSMILPVGEITGFCRRNGITESNFFLSVLCQVLARYSRENEVALTTISSGRADSRLQNAFGMFVKTLPVVAQIRPQPIIDFVKSVQEQFFATMENEDFPFTRMVEKHGIVPQISYAYQGGFDFSLTADEQPVEVEGLASDSAIMPVMVQIFPKPDGYHLNVEFDRTKYSHCDISRFASAFSAAVRFMSESPTKSTSEIPLITEAQKQSILQLSAGPVLEFDRNDTFIDLFRRQVAKFPDKTAVVDEVSSLTYSELDLRSDLLASTLVEMGVRPNTFVSIMLSRSKEFMVSVIAILKAGGAYLPLDCEYPNDRITYMLENSESKLLITERGIFEAKQKEGGFNAEQLLFINDFNFNTDAPARITSSPQPGDLAYMIYTSGSTGKPKGVMIRHTSLVAFLTWYREAANLDHKDALCCHPSFSFDASVIDLFASLSVGAALHIIPTSMRQDMIGLSKYIVREHITGGVFSTQFGMELLNQFDLPLRFTMLGGEKLVSIRKQKTLIINGYGPTEFTVASHYHRVNQDLALHNIPIGRPIPNSWSYVMDANMQLLPVGMAGELCLSGIQIAKGYWRRDDLTAEKFLSNPHQTTEENSRLYRTGDLVRWNNEGELLYLGRIDNQVKLRGFRIELGEIESTICKFGGVASAVVDVKEFGGAQHLCGYYTVKPGCDVEASLLYGFLKTGLTEYMVPSSLIQLESMPMTPGGKVDRKALPLPKHNRLVDYVAPTNEVEANICRIFSDLLKTEKVSILDDFFEIGGSSMSAMKVVIQMMNLGYQITYGNVFQLKTPKAIAAFLQNSDTSNGATETDLDDISRYDYTAINKVLSENEQDLWENFEKRPVGDVLLTGATGYLGIHVLKELIDHESGVIYCLIRSSAGLTAEKRLKIQLMYYFSDTYDHLIGTRIRAVDGDITNTESLNSLKTLGISTVYNCAASVKHFSASDELERINVHGVANLVDFCRDEAARLVHVSTISISGTIDKTSFSPHLLLNESKLYLGQKIDNAYVLTKFKAERLVLQAVSEGLDAKIMRVGNLMGRHSDGEFQINFRSNAFVNMLKSYKVLGMFPLSQMTAPAEISPIDCVARVVVTLSTTPRKMSVFHAYNNYRLDMANVIYAMKDYGFDIKLVSDACFNEQFQTLMKNPAKSEHLSGLLHHSMVEDVMNIPDQNAYTTLVLYKNNVRWPLTDDNYSIKLIKLLDGMGMFDEV